MRRARLMLLAGALMLIGAAAGFVVVPEYAPAYGCSASPSGLTYCLDTAPKVLISGHLSQTTYDVLRVATWALVIVGLIVVTLGVIRYWRESTHTT